MSLNPHNHICLGEGGHSPAPVTDSDHIFIENVFLPSEY